MNINKIKKAYFIGIGGIGMSALARYLKQRGVEVSGYDKTQTALTRELQTEDIPVRFFESLEQLPENIDLVVYTPAIPNNHWELGAIFRANPHRFVVKKRSEVLQWISEEAFTIAVAGTHGKTSVTSMITHILKHSGYDCTAFVGGIMQNYNSNYVGGKNKVVVVEADEYDRSFLRLHPDMAVITAADADHLDIYGDKQSIEKGFVQFANQIKPGGHLLIKKGLSIEKHLDKINKTTYSLIDKDAVLYIKKINIIKNNYSYYVIKNDKNLGKFELNIGGHHNIENTLPAMGIALQLGIKIQAIKDALKTFKGIKRRFEYIIQNKDLVMIDDYAHHPEEINALLYSVRELYPKSHILTVFQPHLYSRTRDFLEGFSDSLNKSDGVVLLDIYPAREEPIPGISSKLIYDKLMMKQKYLWSKKELVNNIGTLSFDVLLMVGAGDIDKIVIPVKEKLKMWIKNK